MPHHFRVCRARYVNTCVRAAVCDACVRKSACAYAMETRSVFAATASQRYRGKYLGMMMPARGCRVYRLIARSHMPPDAADVDIPAPSAAAHAGLWRASSVCHILFFACRAEKFYKFDDCALIAFHLLFDAAVARFIFRFFFFTLLMTLPDCRSLLEVYTDA